MQCATPDGTLKSMTDTSLNQPDERNVSASERMALLHTLAFTALRLCVAQFGDFTTRLITVLSRHAMHSEDAGEAEIYRHAEQYLSEHRLTFHRFFSESLQRLLLQEAQAACDASVAKGETDMMDPSLRVFDAMEHKLLLDYLKQLQEAVDPVALAALNMRVGCWLQSTAKGTATNPFRPEVFLNAVDDAWQKFDVDGKSHHPVLRQMWPEIFLQFGVVWQALNREFAARGVVPDAEEKCANTKEAASRLEDRLRRRLAPGGRLSSERAKELLESMFVQISHEKTIAANIRPLFAPLEEPLCKKALSDMRFFFTDRHPARRLLDTLIECVLGYEAAKDEQDEAQAESRADPLYQAVEKAIAQVVQEGAEDVVCERLVSALQALVEKSLQAAGSKLHDTIAAATEDEQAAHIQTLAGSEVASRIQSGEVAGFIETFLQEQWSRVLAHAYSVRDAKPDVLQDVLKAMDNLIWSVQPKAGPDERKALVNRLPALLAALNAWLDIVKWESAERQAFFTSLAERHTAIIRGPAELTPRDQLEIRMNTVQKASEHQLSRRALQQQEESLAKFMLQIDGIVPGRWVEFVRNNGSKINCRLTWISPGRSRLVFVGRQGQLVFALERKALAEALRADRASVIAIDILAAAMAQSSIH